MILVGPTATHRIRVSHKRGIAVTDCGHFFSPLNINIKDLPFNDETANLFMDRTGIPLCRCFHCGDRQPAWERIYRKFMRQTSRMSKAQKRRARRELYKRLSE